MLLSIQSDKTDVKINWWSFWEMRAKKNTKNLDSLSSATYSVQSPYHLESSIYPHWPSEGKSLHYCNVDILLISSSEKAVIVQLILFLTADQLSGKNNANLKYVRKQKMLQIIVPSRNFPSWTIQPLVFTYINKHVKVSTFASVYVQLYLFLHLLLN